MMRNRCLRDVASPVSLYMVSKTENGEYTSGWKNCVQEVENFLLQDSTVNHMIISSLVVKNTSEITLNIGQSHKSMQSSR